MHEEWVAPYRGRFDGGWDNWRRDTLARQKELGVLPEGAVLAPRNSEDGPSFSQFNLRVTWTLPLGGGGIDFIAEAFNLFNTVNYDVNSIDSSEYLSGPTLAAPALPYVDNPNFGDYSATLTPREIQLGLRYRF